MAQVKDEAFYEAQAAASALALARLRRPKLEAALALVDDLAARMADLTAQRDALHDGPTKVALGHVISILTSAPGMVKAEIAALPKEPQPLTADFKPVTWSGPEEAPAA